MVVAVVVARHSLLLVVKVDQPNLLVFRPVAGAVFVSAMVADLAAVVVEQQTLFAATESDARQA
jgi:hypothetical protein